jgi:hypothetical protein
MENKLWCCETFIQADSSDPNSKRFCLGESEPYETRFTTTGELYRACVKALGRCIGKVYIDPNAQQVGWIFLKKAPDNNGCIETWVSVFTKQPKKVSWTKAEYPTFR